MELRPHWRTPCAAQGVRCARWEPAFAPRLREVATLIALAIGNVASGQFDGGPVDATELFSGAAPVAAPVDDARPFPGQLAPPPGQPTLGQPSPASPPRRTPAEVPLSSQRSLFDDPDRGVQRADARSDQLLGGVQPVAAPVSGRRVSAEEVFGLPISEIRVTGNRSIPTYAIERLITDTRVGRPVVAEQILQDKTRLVNTRWFLSVRDRVELSEAGPVVVFEVIEAPKLERVEFIGNDKGRFSRFNDEKLIRETGLVPGHGFDVAANEESVNRIRQLYRDKGYNYAEVTLKKGGHRDDREVIIEIKPGPRVGVTWTSFEGNRFVSDAVLRQHIETERQFFLPFRGRYNPELIQNDVLSLKSYYEGLGFFDVQVDSREAMSADKSGVHVIYTINEGTRYRVRAVELTGNSVLGRQQLLKDLKLKPGDAFNSRFLAQDSSAMKDQYDALGRPFATVQPVPRFLPEAGWLDLVYEINEDKVCRVGAINVRIRGDETHTQTAAVRHRINRYLKPGELAKAKDIQAARTIISTDPIFDREDPPSFNVRRVTGEDYFSPTSIARGQNVTGQFDGRGGLRPASLSVSPDLDPSGQQPLWRAPGVNSLFGNDAPTQGFVPPPVVPQMPQFAPPPAASSPQPAGDRTTAYLAPTARTRRDQPVEESTDPAVATVSDGLGGSLRPDFLFKEVAVERALEQAAVVRAQSMDPRGQPNPQNYLYEDSTQGDPFGSAIRSAPPDFVDIDIDVTEGRTGRLMFGAGVNSNAGLVGNLVLQEDNFDITRLPRSWSDFIHGRAFRGGGQSFRLEAVPGTQVSRYTASWRTPYFLGTDFSFGVDGFYYNRFYQNWTEDRLGGRLSLGYIINRYWTAGATLRLENVDFRDFINVPGVTPQLYYDVAGDNFLSTVQLRIARDTRDSPFLPSKGNFVELAYEQAFGEFHYPRIDLTLNQFFTVWERADGTGKHTLQLRGETIWTGSDTPVFERLYAGGFQSFRGFQFRGITPRQNSFAIGGTWSWLNTIEYQFPITAGNGVRGVVFSDFGTVDTDISLDKFRASAGFGFRFFIPAMGPAPLAFDFAWPILSEAEDNEQVFSFYVGTTF